MTGSFCKDFKSSDLCEISSLSFSNFFLKVFRLLAGAGRCEDLLPFDYNVPAGPFCKALRFYVQILREQPENCLGAQNVKQVMIWSLESRMPNDRTIFSKGKINILKFDYFLDILKSCV